MCPNAAGASMSREAALKFREYLKSNPDVQDRAREIIRKIGRMDNVILGRVSGFEFTEADARQAWDEIVASGQLTPFEKEMSSLGLLDGAPLPAAANDDDDELTDIELEIVSGGGRYPCNTDDTRFAADDNNRSFDGGNTGK